MRRALAAVTIIKAAAVGAAVKEVAHRVEVVVLVAEADVVARDVVVLVLPVAVHLVVAFLAAGAARLEAAAVDSRPVVAEEEHRHEISSILTHSVFTFTS